MSNYFLLGWKDKPPVASALEPEGTKPAYQLIPELEGKEVLPFELNLTKLSIGKKGLERSADLSDLNPIWLDYQPNGLAFPLMSEKMKLVIEQYVTGNEGISWIKAAVHGNEETRNYYVLRFTKPLDVLDEQKTMFVPGTTRVIKPYFSIEKISGYAIFPKPAANDGWKITPAVYINEALKKSLHKEKLTGIMFDKTLVG